jgi:hypothetical protein
MLAKSKSWVLALVLLSVFALFAPHKAYALDPPSVALKCDDGSFDNDMATQRSAFAQQKFNLAHNINTMFPIIPAMNQCVQNIMNVMAKLPNLASPLGIASAIINPILQSIISSVCSQVMGVITQAQNAITQYAKICLPMPKFNFKLDLPTFNAQACSGGLVISPLTNFTSPAHASYNYQQYQGH